MPIMNEWTWRTSTFTSDGESCVEVAVIGVLTALRDTKHRASGHLTIPAVHGRTFIATVKAGCFDR